MKKLFRKLFGWLWRDRTPEPAKHGLPNNGIVTQSEARRADVDYVPFAQSYSLGNMERPIYGVSGCAPAYREPERPADEGPDLFTTVATVAAVEAMIESSAPDPPSACDSPASFDSAPDPTPDSGGFGGGDSGGAGAASGW